MPKPPEPIDELPAYETPVIVKVEPQLSTDDLRDFAKEDEAMFKALEEVEKQISRHPAGGYSIPPDVSNPFKR